ncbi:MAG: hypothetical protein AAF495_19350, partial [Pseudomonadota bacterium]
EVSVVHPHNLTELFRFDVGRAPQGIAVAPDGTRLYIHNFMDRTVSVHDISAAIGDIACRGRPSRGVGRRSHYSNNRLGKGRAAAGVGTGCRPKVSSQLGGS